MKNAPRTPKPEPKVAVPARAGKAHTGHGHDTSRLEKNCHETVGLESHKHDTHRPGQAPALVPTNPTSASPAWLSRPPVTSVLGWPAWLRVLAVLPVIVLLWLAVAWASAEVAPW